jgi:hypothetical protein
MGNEWDKVDQVAETLDDLTTIVDELKDQPPDDVEPEAIDRLKQTLERATDAADAIENQKKP